MKALPQISEAEFEVMKVIWKQAPISTNENARKKYKSSKIIGKLTRAASKQRLLPYKY